MLPRILGVGLSTPAEQYSQKHLVEWFQPSMNPTLLRFLEHPHIQTRNVTLPPKDPETGFPVEESTGQLLERFKRQSLAMSRAAMDEALMAADCVVKDIDFICYVTSTGFIVPGLSAHFLREVGLNPHCQRADLVGMGCNAGLNGLAVCSNWCAANPGGTALLICSEVCSAIYSIDDSPRTGMVNSLFGDGTAALILRTGDGAGLRPGLRDFASRCMPEHIEALRFDWDDKKHRYSFYVGKETPGVLAENAPIVVEKILRKNGLKQSDVKHWIVHTGGAAILDGLEQRLKLKPQDLRHTRAVLRDHGNISSGSFLFSYKRLESEGTVSPGDHGLFMTMGPGLTIELALLRW